MNLTRNRAVIWWFIGILVVGINGCVRSPEAKRDKFLWAGKKLLDKREYTRAVLEFRNATRAMPRDAESSYQLGLAYVGMKELQGAWSSFKTAISLDPHHKGAELQLAMILASTSDQERLREAEGLLSDLLESTPSDLVALNTMALTELKLGKTEKAEEHLQRALALAPQSMNNIVMLAQTRIARKDLPGAEEVFKKACQNAPRSADAALLLAEFYVATNRPPEAEQQLLKALELNPGSAPALLRLGKLQARTGRKLEAEQTFKRLSSLPDPLAKPVHAMYLFEEGRRAEAIAEFEQLVKQDPANRAARARLVAAYRELGRNNDAEPLLNAEVAKNTMDLDALLQRSELFLATGRLEDAQADLYRAIQVNPNSPEVHHMLARVHQARGSASTQQQELFEALRLSPTLLGARIELAQSLLASKAAKVALEILDQTPAHQQRTLAVIVQRNWALWTLHEMAALRKGIDAGLSLQRSPDLLIQQGLLNLKENNFSGAQAVLEEALRLDPRDLRAIEVLRRSYVAQKQPSTAVKKVEEYAAKHPRSAPVQTFLGNVLASSGESAKARAAFEAAKAADPAFEAAEMSLTQLDSVDGKWDSASERLKAIVTANASNVLARFWLGNVEEIRGNRQESAMHYQRVIEANPNHAQALNNLAFLLAERDERTDEALKYAQEAQELVPNNPDFADTLGWVFYRKGLYSLAAKQFERAVSQGNSDPVCKYHLAMAYAKLGDSKRGRVALQAALERNPKLPEAKMAADLLGQVQ